MTTTSVRGGDIRGWDDINLSDLTFWARPPAERDAAFALLRRERPLSFHPEPDIDEDWVTAGPGYWAVTRYADIEEASHHPEVFSSAAGATNTFDLPPEFLEFFGSMINMDAPRHLRLRRIVSRAFSPRMIERTEADIASVAARIAGELAERGPGGDFVTDVAARLPLEIICRMMGIPAESWERVFACSNTILGAQDPEYVPPGENMGVALLTAAGELSTLVQQLVAERRAAPTDDLTTALAQAEVDGERLTDSEIGSFFILLLVAGNETTRNAISSGLVVLTEHPAARAAWQASFDELAPTATDELVRWATPVTWMRRTLTAPYELSGQQLRAGEKVLLFYNSANRDEAVFADPYTFDPRRDPNPHLGFGGAGPHFCLGAHLARREITELYRALFDRVPEIHAAGEPQRLVSSFINGIKHVRCEF